MAKPELATPQPPPAEKPPAFSRELHEAGSPADRLQLGVDLVKELVDSCDSVGVTLATPEGLRTPAATDDRASRGDALQYTLGEGPCLDSVQRQSTVISDDVEHDRRWPLWAPRAAREIGVRSMMCLLLYTHERSYGALNLYADARCAWTPDDIGLAHALAEQLAVAVGDAQQIEHRGRAMVNRTIIGQAQGIVMERFDVSAEQAFSYLRRVSQNTNRKLVQLAIDLVATRQLPAESPVPSVPSPTHRPVGTGARQEKQF